MNDNKKRKDFFVALPACDHGLRKWPRCSEFYANFEGVKRKSGRQAFGRQGCLQKKSFGGSKRADPVSVLRVRSAKGGNTEG